MNKKDKKLKKGKKGKKAKPNGKAKSLKGLWKNTLNYKHKLSPSVFKLPPIDEFKNISFDDNEDLILTKNIFSPIIKQQILDLLKEDAELRDKAGAEATEKWLALSRLEDNTMYDSETNNAPPIIPRFMP